MLIFYIFFSTLFFIISLFCYSWASFVLYFSSFLSYKVIYLRAFLCLMYVFITINFPLRISFTASHIFYVMFPFLFQDTFFSFQFFDSLVVQKCVLFCFYFNSCICEVFFVVVCLFFSCLWCLVSYHCFWKTFSVISVF